MTHSGSRLSTAALNALCPLVLYALVRDQWSLLAADSQLSQREPVFWWAVGHDGTLHTRQRSAILALVYEVDGVSPGLCRKVLGLFGLEVGGVLPFFVVLCQQSGGSQR